MTDLEQFAEEIASHVMATGRKPREVIQCLIDEGYVEMDDEAVEECIRLVALLGFAEFVTKAIPNSEGESGLVTHPTDQGRYTAKEGALATPAEQFRIEAAKPQWWEAAPLKSRSGCSVCGSSVLSQIGR